MSAEFIFTMRGVSRFHPPDHEVLTEITLAFFPGAKIGVIGANGAGKSSLLRIMAGVDNGFTGEAELTSGFTVGLLEQEPTLDDSLDVLGNVMQGVSDTAALLENYDRVLASWSEPDADFDKLGTQQADLEARIEAVGGWDLQRKVAVAMDALRLPPPEGAVSTLSGGERRRVALCRLLLSRPDLLLLDEPTNHLDAESVSWLERHLIEYPGTVVAITHDRYFLDNVAEWILELDHGRGIPYRGNYSGWLEQKKARLETQEKHDRTRAKTLERELEWVRMAPKARQAKSKARLAAYDRLLADAEGKAGNRRGSQISIPPGPRLGDLVLEADHLSKGFGDRLLIEDLSFSLPRAGIVAVIGANGAGKTTLFRMIIAAYTHSGDPAGAPDSGELRLGSTVKLAYVDQSRDLLDPDKSVYEEITDGLDTLELGNREINGRAYVASFNFRGSDQQKVVAELSGGERNRVHLAKVLKEDGNVLLLDEPTNDLDVDTLRALEDALESFPGCAAVISHDRWFLDRIATHVLAFEGDSRVRWFEGNFSDYELARRRELGVDADQPHRINYKPLERGVR